MANKIIYRTEDEVRDSAKIQLGFDKVEDNVKQGTGQITTFNQLGFKGVIDKPDGWYLPDSSGIFGTANYHGRICSRVEKM